MIQHECAVKFCFSHRAQRRAAAAVVAARRARTVLVEAEGAAHDPRTRERGARPGEEAVLRAAAAACAEIKVQTKVSSNA